MRITTNRKIKKTKAYRIPQSWVQVGNKESQGLFGFRFVDDDSVRSFASGVVSTACPPYERIPLSATRALANRIARGIRLKGAGAWNALSKNQEAATDKEFVLNRLGHVIEHAQKAIARIAGTMPPCDAEEAADGGDAGAILFGGALLAEYMERAANAKD